VRVYAGTSGFSYAQWKGRFYPRGLRTAQLLGYYAQRLPAVEINNTFYRMPKAETLRDWAAQTPESFRFVLKAPRRITHLKRLQDTAEETSYLLRTAQVLGERLGAVLYQLPPSLRADRERLARFLGSMPQAVPAAFEFRHPSWWAEPVFETLREHDAALCVAEVEGDGAPLVATASWGYLRLRRGDYDAAGLRDWAAHVQAQPWRTAYVFFKHEDEATGPRLAQAFLEVMQQRG